MTSYSLPKGSALPKVVHIITGLEDGGAESVLFRLCANDTAADHCVISLGGMGKYGPALEDIGVKVVALGMPRGRLQLGAMAKLFGVLRKARPDAVQTWMYHADLLGGLVARLAGCKNIFWGIRHSELDPSDTSRLTRLVMRLSVALSRFVPKRIICVGHRAQLAHARYGYDARKLGVIQNGLDLARWFPDPAAREQTRSGLGLADCDFVIGMVARYNPQKDHMSLVMAASEIATRGNNFKVVLVGAGMLERSAIFQEVQKLGLQSQFHFLGPRTDVPDLMRAFDLHVLSSRSGEGFPNVVAEAMASGTPCVATDVGDSCEIIGENGWCVPPGEPNLLAAACIEAMDERRNDLFWSSRCDASREKVKQNYSIDKMIRRYHVEWFS